ncbi:MAG TPA: multicopper oxidase [Terriglobales bacterium]|nr:multicopper oxidase [Terriglobales bacterium]
MSLTRRQFLAQAAASAAAWRAFAQSAGPAPRPDTLDPNRLRHYLEPLPRPPLAQPLHPGLGAASHYRLRMHAADCSLHPDLPPTRCWTYGGSFPGPFLEARRGEAVTVEWINALPAQHFLPVDHTLEGASRSLPPVRAVVHLHGGRVPSASDGYPEHWSVPGQSQTFHYPNLQDAALLFYHDHAMGLNRLNIYAGLFGLYILRDPVEDALGLPGGDYEIPLALCDRWLDPRAQLYYPTSGIPGHPWVPEVFGNAILLNGKLWPRLEVEPRPYRFRIANAANSRFFRLALAPAIDWQLIGTDQGLLPAPVALGSLLLAPAERADLIVDFSAHAGQTLHLRNDEQPVMQVQVLGRAGAHTGWRASAPLRPLARIPAAAAVRSRWLGLQEYDDLGANPMLMLLDGKRWSDPVSETPTLDSTEIWAFANLTDDTHPIHLHLVRFQVLDRRPFDAAQYRRDRRLRYLGPAQPPGPDEMGWKDTVRCYPGAVTRIIVRFQGYAGRYLWHCHLLEHEANAMMRPYEVVINPSPSA